MKDLHITNPVIHPNNEVGGCYVSRGTECPEWINVHVQQARQRFPNETVDNAIRALAIEIFTMKEDFERINSQRAFTGYQ